jgi:hypothetical protein
MGRHWRDAPDLKSCGAQPADFQDFAASGPQGLAESVFAARISVMINRVARIAAKFMYLRGCTGWLLR